MREPSGTAVLFTGADLRTFFQERVEDAMRHQRAPISQETGCYLTSLLVDQSHRDENPGPETLVEMQAQAMASPSTRAVNLWRRMGDHALVITGFFHEHIEQRRLSRAYYTEMGAGAYARLGRLFQGPGLGRIFEELGTCFPAAAEVLMEVREEAQPCTDDDILRLYDQYCRSGSPRIGERLRRLGVVPVRLTVEG